MKTVTRYKLAMLVGWVLLIIGVLGLIVPPADSGPSYFSGFIAGSGLVLVIYTKFKIWLTRD